ncbi:MAG: hypothetical protein IT335_04440 [Thermomicrobiales bacterium]|jgi:hypothetical protein|nr:hypothetical protein [Thermomicrobiales bacterium]
MARTIVATQEVMQLVNQLARDDERAGDLTIVDATGDEVAVLLDPAVYHDLVEKSDRRDWAFIEKSRKALEHIDPDEVDREVDAVVEEVRSERWAVEKGAA